MDTISNNYNNLVLENCRIIDLESGEIIYPVTIGISKDFISWIKKDSVCSDPLNVQEFHIDCKNHYIIPGLIDLHVHICEEPVPYLAKNFRYDESFEKSRLRAIKNLSTALRSGITTVRDMGSYKGRAIKIRDELMQNIEYPLPSIFACGEAITPKGGHWYSRCIEATTTEEIKVAIRKQVGGGSDFIKIMHEPDGYSQKEIDCAVEESLKAGVPIACHAYIPKFVEEAIKAGVSTIEHVCQLSPQMILQAIERKIVLVPTVICSLRTIVDTRLSVLSKDEEIFFTKWIDWQKNGLPLLIKTPALIGVGTDAGFPPIFFDDLINELELLIKLGMSNLDALRSATHNAAIALGKCMELGKIKQGYKADLIVLDRNPLEELYTLRNPVLVVKNGRIAIDNRDEMLIINK